MGDGRSRAAHAWLEVEPSVQDSSPPETRYKYRVNKNPNNPSWVDSWAACAATRRVVHQVVHGAVHQLIHDGCAPWRAKRRRVVPGRRRRERPGAGGGNMQSASDSALSEGSAEARAAASQRARGEAAPGAGRTGATKAVAKERVRPAAGAPGRIHSPATRDTPAAHQNKIQVQHGVSLAHL